MSSARVQPIGTRNRLEMETPRSNSPQRGVLRGRRRAISFIAIRRRYSSRCSRQLLAFVHHRARGRPKSLLVARSSFERRTIMKRFTWANGWYLGVIAASSTAACGTADPDANVQIGSSNDAVLGDRLSGVSSADFAEAKAAFQNVESINDGVGPIFNERSCGGCHANGAVGGAGENIERRFGRFVNGIFDPLADLGGTLRQLFSVVNFNNPNLPASSRGTCQAGNPTLCCIPVEVDPPQATVRNVGRLTTPLFGLGLVDAMPDSFFDGLAAAEPAAIRGFVNRVIIVLPDPRDPTQI